MSLASAASESPSLSKQRLRVWLRLLRTTRGIEAQLRERLRVDYETTLPRFDVLAALFRDQKGMRMSELSSVLKVSNGNVTGIVERLVSDGLIVRTAVEGDRRAMLVRLTRKGRDYFSGLAEAHESWLDELLRDVDAARAADLIALLDGVHADRGASR